MPETKIKLGTFVKSFVYDSQEIEIVKSRNIVFWGLALDFLKSIEDSENADSVYFVDKVLPVESSVRNPVLVIYINEEKL